MGEMLTRLSDFLPSTLIMRRAAFEVFGECNSDAGISIQALCFAVAAWPESDFQQMNQLRWM